MAKDDAKIEMRKRKKGDDADLDITPMIDITFLLLAFFVVGVDVVVMTMMILLLDMVAMIDLVTTLLVFVVVVGAWQ